MITISQGHNNARLGGTLSHLNTGATRARLRVLSGARPAAGGAETTLLVEVPLTNPAGSVVSNVLVLTALNAFDLAVNTGTAVWGRVINANGDWNSDVSVSTVAAGTGEVQFEDTTILAGSKVSHSTMAFG